MAFAFMGLLVRRNTKNLQPLGSVHQSDLVRFLIVTQMHWSRLGG